MNHFHHIKVSPLRPHSVPALSPLRYLPLGRMVASFQPIVPTVPMLSVGSTLNQCAKPQKNCPTTGTVRSCGRVNPGSGGPLFHFQNLACLAAVQVVRPPLH
jgi:hypothetical protein